MPDSVTRRMQTVNSNYDTDTGPAGRAGENPGPPRSERRFQRQHQQNPAAVQPVADPQRLQRDHAAGGRQPQLHPRRLCPDKINFDPTATTSPLFPACAWCINRLSRKICPIRRQQQRAERIVGGESVRQKQRYPCSAVVDLPVRPHPAPDDLPAVPARGAVPNASQLYGSRNLGSSYAGSQRYALIGNTDLKTETSDNLEWG